MTDEELTSGAALPEEAALRPVRPVRVGHIQFLNCYPLYFGLEQRSAGSLAADRAPGGTAPFELVPGVPTDLNRMVAAGTIDFGPVSSIAYAYNQRSLALSRRLSISSRGAVDSIQLVARRPVEQIESVALTPQSATSVMLLKVLMKLRYEREVDYTELLLAPEEELREHDAVLLIGDQGLEAMYFPLPGARRYDLGDLWYEWQGLPMVFAVWAARLDFLRRYPDRLLAVEEELVQAIEYSRANVSALVQRALGKYRFGRSCLERYFGVLHYGFEPVYQAGLERFYRLAYEAGEIPDAPPLRFLDDVVEESVPPV